MLPTAKVYTSVILSKYGLSSHGRGERTSIYWRFAPFIRVVSRIILCGWFVEGNRRLVGVGAKEGI